MSLIPSRSYQPTVGPDDRPQGPPPSGGSGVSSPEIAVRPYIEENKRLKAGLETNNAHRKVLMAEAENFAATLQTHIKKIRELEKKNYELIAEKDKAWNDGYNALEFDIAKALELEDLDATPINENIEHLMRDYKLIKKENRNLRSHLDYARESKGYIGEENEKLRNQLEAEKYQREQWQDKYCKMTKIRDQFVDKINILETALYNFKQSIENIK